MPEPTLSRDELTRLLSGHFAEFLNPASGVTIEEMSHGSARVRQASTAGMLRPGGTISGPTMMALTDFTMYVALLSAIGWVPLVVTTQLNINFLRRPEPVDLIAEGRLLKLGKRLAVGEVVMRSDGQPEPIAHATSTYSIPRGGNIEP
jgi:uncharacterized protein (TIGR00369 family)